METISSGRRIYITVLLAAISMLAIADRNVLAVLLVPIQKDLGVSDTAMGALTGIAFSLVYATVALPAARLADRSNRRNIIGLALAFWSVMTLVCGMAANYMTLLLGRIGVAAGEAAAHPSQISTVGDLFPPRQRGTAVGFVAVGTAIGVSLGAMVAGLVAEKFGWKMAFMALALPGVVLALIFLMTVPEPRRGAQDGGDVFDGEAQSWKTSLAYLLRIPTFRYLLIGMVFLNAASAGYLAWLPAFLMRVHGLTTAEMSMWFGISIGIGGVLSNAIGGYFSDVLARRGARWRLYFLAIMMAIGVPFLCTIAFTPSTAVVIGSMLALAFFNGAPMAVCSAVGLDIVRPRMRGFMAAVIGFVISVLGTGLGPLLFGAMNDLLRPEFGDDAVRFTMLGTAMCKLFAVIAFFWASRTADQDAAAVRVVPGAAAAGS